MKSLIMFLALLCASLTACGGGSTHHVTPPSTSTSSGWYIGPIANGKNYSKGMPSTPTPQGQGWYFDFPSPAGEVDAVVNTKPRPGITSITVHYTITGGGFLASEESNVPGRVGLAIQRRGDNWSGKGKYQQYRLYATDRPLLVAGEGSITPTAWTDVYGKPASQAVVDGVFADLSNYQIVFGGSFASHGVYSTEVSRFTLDSITVQP